MARACTWPTRPRAGRPSPSSFRSLRSPPQWSRDCSPPSRRCRADGGIVGIDGDRRAMHSEPAPDPHPPAAAARPETTQAGALDHRRRTPGRYSSKRAGWSNNGRSHRWPPTRPRESSKLRPGGCVNTVLIVTLDDALRARLLRGLGGFTIFEAPSDPEALKTLRLVEIDLVLRDSAGPAGALSTFVSGARDVAPSALVVAVGAAGEEEAAADFMVPDGFTTRELDAVLRHALEKQRLVREIKMLRTPSSAPHTPTRGGAGEETSWDNAALARVLKAFSRVFAAGFDLRRVLDTFLEAIGDVVRPTRVAVLLPDADAREFRIAAHRGLAPQIVQSVRLPAGEGLPRWLASQGRPLALHDVSDPDLVRELKLLQGVVATPLLAHGDLVAILVLGQPVFGAGYSRAEIETLFDLVTQLATVIRDIALHQQLEREKEFTERILSHMSSGVITIGRDQRVGTMNRRAEEILGLSAHAVVGQDLRVLPSPLGDLLFDTLSSGRAMPRTEIQLALRRLWIELTTYVIRDEESAPLGAVLVFEDLTAQKELAAQKREADQFQLLTRVVARIADEIKNPLVSINTFIELIGERYDDPDFRRHFSSVVRRDVRRLVEVFEKLAGLVTEGELNFATVDAYEAVTQLVEAIDLADGGLGKHLQLDVAPASEPFPVKVDATQLRKALSYLIRYLTHNSPNDLAKISLSVGRHAEPGGGHDVRILVGSRTAAVSADKLERLFDPVQMVQESLIDVGPAVSQRLVEALGGRLGVKQTRHELSFVVSLPPAVA
ncbi:MAG: hypothetical protein DMD85_05745 [Candidatus Rokuibacteriota bacterium]|nr:MAG: hypothetical protein DMD85_05745 [Candidatus Rokubacteria bacterium]